jgi:Phage lysozyme
MDKKMTETLQDRIIRHEGFCQMPKIDVAPDYEIGFGHDITPAQASGQYVNGISYSEAVGLLEQDIAQCTEQADSHFPWFEQLDPVRQDVLVEQIFQLGISRTLGFHEELAALAVGDWSKAAYEMTNSEWHTQTPARCTELAGLMLNGDSITT